MLDIKIRTEWTYPEDFQGFPDEFQKEIAERTSEYIKEKYELSPLRAENTIEAAIIVYYWNEEKRVRMFFEVYPDYECIFLVEYVEKNENSLITIIKIKSDEDINRAVEAFLNAN